MNTYYVLLIDYPTPQLIFYKTNNKRCNISTRLISFATSVYVFQNEIYKSCMKNRYVPVEEVDTALKDITLHNFLSTQKSRDICFIVNKEIVSTGVYSKPYEVIKSMYEYYQELDIIESYN